MKKIIAVAILATVVTIFPVVPRRLAFRIEPLGPNAPEAVLRISVNSCGVGVRVPRVEPMTMNNNNAILNDEICVALDLSTIFPAFKNIIKQELHPLTNYIIICQSGEIFPDVGYHDVVASSTPGFLLWSNYLGSIFYTDPLAPNPIGMHRRIDFCLGPCTP